MTNVNVFEIASRKKLRFESRLGLLTAEQLWDLPLTSERDGVVTLDTIAKDLSRKIKEADEESFVAVKKNAAAEELGVKLDIVKRVIEVKLADQEAAKMARERAARKQRILEVLAEKDDEVLKSKSREDLLKELAEL